MESTIAYWTDGFAFVFPGRGTALVNLTHVETPLDPVAASRNALLGKAQADRVLHFLRSEYPAAFAAAIFRLIRKHTAIAAATRIAIAAKLAIAEYLTRERRFGGITAQSA